jgi:membrane-bound ClpP family serine protease
METVIMSVWLSLTLIVLGTVSVLSLMAAERGTRVLGILAGTVISGFTAGGLLLSGVDTTHSLAIGVVAGLAVLLSVCLAVAVAIRYLEYRIYEHPRFKYRPSTPTPEEEEIRYRMPD